MENQRLLNECMIIDDRWSEATQKWLGLTIDFDKVADAYAGQLINEVVVGELTVDELRAGVSWVNALDREAVELGREQSFCRDDLVEAVARRLAHQAGRLALNQVKSRRRLLNTSVKTRRNSDFWQQTVSHVE